MLAKSAALGSTPALITLAPRPTGWTTFSADPQRTGWGEIRDGVRNVRIKVR